jgi:hypothetical protein
MAGKERLFLPMRWFCADAGVTGFLDNGPTRRRNCFSDTSCLGCGVIEMAARASGAVSHETLRAWRKRLDASRIPKAPQKRLPRLLVLTLRRGT